MDIKLGNIVLDRSFQLKIIDFDLCVPLHTKNKIGVRGTPCYRPPELREKKPIDNLEAVDVFSMAITLFAAKGATLPFLEDTNFKGYELYSLLQSDPETFWQVHE